MTPTAVALQERLNDEFGEEPDHIAQVIANEMGVNQRVIASAFVGEGWAVAKIIVLATTLMEIAGEAP